MAVPDTIDLVLILLVIFVASHMDVLAILARAAFICIWRLHIRPSQMLKWFIGHMSRNELLEVQSLVNEHLQQGPDNHQGSTDPERSNDRVQSGRNPDIPVIATNLSDSLTPQRMPEPEPSYPVSWREAQASVPDVCIKQDDSSEEKDPEMRESESETFEGAQSLKLHSKTEPERPGTVDVYTPDTINSNPESELLQLKNERQQTRDCEVMSSDSVMDMHEKQSTSHELDVHQAEMPEANNDTINSRNHESGHHGKNEVTKHLHLTHDESDVSLSSTVSFHTNDDVTLSDSSDTDSDDSEIFVTREDPVAAIKQSMFQEKNGFPEHSLNSLAAEMSQENPPATSISQENSWATLCHGHSINTADEHMQADLGQHDNGRAEEMKAMDVQKKQMHTPQAQCGGGKTGKGVQMMKEANSRDDEVPRPEADTSDKADERKEDDVDDGKNIRNTKKDSQARCENEQTTHP